MATCEDALNQIKEQQATNERLRVEWKTKKDNFEKSLIKSREWDSCVNGYGCVGSVFHMNDKINELRNDVRIMNNCALWTDIQHVGSKNHWCYSDFGEGYNHTGNNQHGCLWGQGKGECKRQESQVFKDLIKFMPPRPTVEADPGEFKANPVSNIGCCQSMSFEVASSVVFNDISQTCLQQPQSSPDTQSQSQPNTPSYVSKTPPKKSDIKKKSKTESNNYTMIIIIIALCVISLIFSSSITGIFLV